MLYPVGHHVQLHSNSLPTLVLIIRAGTETDSPGLTDAAGWLLPRQRQRRGRWSHGDQEQESGTGQK